MPVRTFTANQYRVDPSGIGEALVVATDAFMAEQPLPSQFAGLALQDTDVPSAAFGWQFGGEPMRMGVPSVVTPFNAPDSSALWVCRYTGTNTCCPAVPLALPISMLGGPSPAQALGVGVGVGGRVSVGVDVTAAVLV